MDCFLLLYLAFSRLALGFYPNHYYCFHSCLAQCTHHKHIFVQCSMECFPSFISQFLLFVLVLWPLLVHCNRDTDENPQNEMSCRTTVCNPKWTKLCVGWPKCPTSPPFTSSKQKETHPVTTRSMCVDMGSFRQFHHPSNESWMWDHHPNNVIRTPISREGVIFHSWSHSQCYEDSRFSIVVTTNDGLEQCLLLWQC